MEFTKIGPFTFVGDKLLAESFKLTLKEFRIAFYPCRLRGFKVGEDVQLYMLLKLCNTTLAGIENNKKPYRLFKKHVRLPPLKSADKKYIDWLLYDLDSLSNIYLGIKLTSTNRGILYTKLSDFCRKSTYSFLIRKMLSKTYSLVLWMEGL
jgi:hypothetical protein